MLLYRREGQTHVGVEVRILATRYALAALDSRRWIRRTEEASGSETSDDTPQARLLFRLGDQLPRFESRYE